MGYLKGPINATKWKSRVLVGREVLSDFCLPYGFATIFGRLCE